MQEPPGSLSLVGIARETMLVLLLNAVPLGLLALLVVAWNGVMWLMPEQVRVVALLAMPFIGPLPFLIWLDVISASLASGRAVRLREVFHGGPLRVLLAFVLTAGLSGALLTVALFGLPLLFLWLMSTDVGMNLMIATRGSAFPRPGVELGLIGLTVALVMAFSVVWYGLVGVLAGRDRFLGNVWATLRSPFVAPVRFAAWHFVIAGVLVLALKQFDKVMPPPKTMQELMAQADKVPWREVIKMLALVPVLLWTSAANVVMHRDLTR